MNQALEIEKDLQVWSGRKWAAAILGLFALQIALLFAGSKPAYRRTVYPSEPGIRFAPRSLHGSEGEWVSLENPLLFASADLHGFSATAWLRKLPLPSLEGAPLPRPDYVQFQPPRLPAISRAEWIAPPSLSFYHIAPVIPNAAGAPVEPRGASTVLAEGFHGLRYLGNLKPSVQFVNDALGPTVVETVVDQEGFVISARVLNSSGSKAADADAVNLSRQARFDTPPALPEQKAPRFFTGKLIFEWFALDSTRTNNVSR